MTALSSLPAWHEGDPWMVLGPKPGVETGVRAEKLDLLEAVLSAGIGD